MVLGSPHLCFNWLIRWGLRLLSTAPTLLRENGANRKPRTFQSAGFRSSGAGFRPRDPFSPRRATAPRTAGGYPQTSPARRRSTWLRRLLGRAGRLPNDSLHWRLSASCRTAGRSPPVSPADPSGPPNWGARTASRCGRLAFLSAACGQGGGLRHHLARCAAARGGQVSRGLMVIP